MQELAKRYPLYTTVESYSVPTIQAQIDLNGKDAVGALAQLRNAANLEYGLTVGNSNNSCLYPIYLRGEAYMAAGQDGGGSSRRLSTIPVSCGIVLPERWHIWNWGELTRLRETR